MFPKKMKDVSKASLASAAIQILMLFVKLDLILLYPPLFF
jgi:hypothetical protein